MKLFDAEQDIRIKKRKIRKRASIKTDNLDEVNKGDLYLLVYFCCLRTVTLFKQFPLQTASCRKIQ